MNGSIEETVKSTIAQIARKKPADVKERDLLVEDLGMDSLEEIELAQQLEVVFGLQVNDETLRGLRTVGDVIRYITKELKGEKER